MDWDVLAVARSEIGSNRQNRGNRFLTVIQYCLDMALAVRETARVTKPNGKQILVLGRESSVRGTPFFNGEIVAELAARRKRCCVTMSSPTPHGDKLRALSQNDKLPPSDRPSVKTAITRYEAWIDELDGTQGTGKSVILPMVS